MSQNNNISFSIPEDVTVLNEKHFDYASIRLRSDGITQINTHDDLLHTIDKTLDIHTTVNIMNGTNPILLLTIAGKHTSSDDESRTFMASEEGRKNRIAMAYVLQSLAQRIVANFYFRMKKPVTPTKFFTNQEEAEQWLLSVKKNNSVKK